MLTREDLARVQQKLQDSEIHQVKLFGPQENTIGKEAIQLFFENRHSPENMQFLIAMDKLLNDRQLDLRRGLVQIYRLHLAKDAPALINLDTATFKPLHKYFNTDKQKFIFRVAETKENKEELEGALLNAVGKILLLLSDNIKEAEIEEKIKEIEKIKEAKKMVALAELRLTVYPYTRVQENEGGFELPCLDEYVSDKSGHAARKAALSNYGKWMSFVKKDKGFVVSVEKYLDSKHLTEFDDVYQKYTKSLVNLKDLKASGSLKKSSAVDYRVATAEWESIDCLNNLVKALDKWLDYQSKYERNENLKKSEVFKNILGFKQEILKEYASRIEGFITDYGSSQQLNVDPVKNLAGPPSFFHLHYDSSDDENVDRNDSEPSCSSLASTTSDGSVDKEDDKWRDLALPRNKI